MTLLRSTHYHAVRTLTTINSYSRIKMGTRRGSSSAAPTAGCPDNSLQRRAPKRPAAFTRYKPKKRTKRQRMRTLAPRASLSVQ